MAAIAVGFVVGLDVEKLTPRKLEEEEDVTAVPAKARLISSKVGKLRSVTLQRASGRKCAENMNSNRNSQKYPQHAFRTKAGGDRGMYSILHDMGCRVQFGRQSQSAAASRVSCNAFNAAAKQITSVWLDSACVLSARTRQKIWSGSVQKREPTSYCYQWATANARQTSCCYVIPGVQVLTGSPAGTL